MKFWIILVFIFLFSLTLRFWNFNSMGQWSDEPALIEKGYILTDLIGKQDFSNPFWYKEAADHPPFSMYFYGLASRLDFVSYDPNMHSYFWDHKGAPVFRYDFTYARLVSVLISSIAVVLVFLIGARYFSLFVGVASAIILSMLPHFLAYSQLITYESWVMCFFTLCAFTYFLYLEKNKKYLLILSGLLTGLTLGVKESTIIVFGLYVGTYFVWKKITKKKTITFWHLPILGVIAFATYVAIWPFPWLHFPEYSSYVYDLWFKNHGLIPELIFGKRMGAHAFYYPLAFLITTPLVILILTYFGLKFSYDQRKKWIFAALIVWFLVPFLMMGFHHRQHMVRYIIEIYAPMAILSAIGLEYVVSKVTKNGKVKYFSIFPLFIYLLLTLLSVTPYYLWYFNELVGGTNNVYKNKLFLMGWFGEGLKAPGEYVAKHAQKNAKIGLAIDPYPTSVYRVPDLTYENFNPKHTYDYIILNYYNVIRIGFNEDSLKKDYVLVYTEKANNADIAFVYKHK